LSTKELILLHIFLKAKTDWRPRAVAFTVKKVRKTKNA